ncbi:MAG: serine/threonine-protein kinase [Planctomycetota bacterium]
MTDSHAPGNRGTDSHLLPVIRGFQLTELLSRTASGNVYLARHTKSGQEAEVKLMHVASRDDTRTALRVRREVQALTRLKFAHIIGGGVDEESGREFLLMERVPGITLDQHLAKVGRLRFQDALAIHLRILEAIAVAHKADVLHRDIQPRHVLVADDGRVLLRGFSLAKIVTGGDDGEGTLAQNESGDAVLNLFRAPEQLEEEECTPRTDIYSIGLVLYVSLLGTLPWDGPPMEQVLARMSVPAIPANRRDESVPDYLSNLLGRMLAIDPFKRPASAEETARLLRGEDE